jgi:hypothetical protein
MPAPPLNEEIFLLAQLVNQQQQQISDLFHAVIALSPNDAFADMAVDEMEDEAGSLGTLRPPQGGRRISKEDLLEMTEEGCRWQFR